MPDQTPVTDDRIAHQWESKHRNDGNVGLAAVARAIRAHVPAPPATLAAELRYRATLLYNGDPDGDSAAVINALADRVEAVEKERDEARTKVEEVEGHLSKSWRQRDAKDVELERLSREREQQEKALVEHGRLLAEARAAFDEVENRNLNLEADLRESHAEVERLTASLNRQCTTVTPSVHNTDGLTASNDTLPDLPEPYKSIDGSRHWGHGVSWYPEHGLCRWEDGVGGSTTAEALRQEAAELLAAASYAERNKE